MPARPRNDIGQYDDLAAQWWNLKGPFATLHWIAEARAALVPVSTAPGAVLVDLACGAGLLAPHIEQKGYLHVGLDMTASALEIASEHNVVCVQGDVMRLPIADGCADVVCAGEIFEHVDDIETLVAESCRILKPGGLLVLDTIADTALARLVVVTIAERIPGGAPPGIHDPKLFVNRRRLVDLYAANGVSLRLLGLRPSLRAAFAWKFHGKSGRMVPVPLTTVLFQGWGRKTA